MQETVHAVKEEAGRPAVTERKQRGDAPFVVSLQQASCR
jgi:hypothetical protein